MKLLNINCSLPFNIWTFHCPMKSMNMTIYLFQLQYVHPIGWHTVKWLFFARDLISLISLDSKFAKLNQSLKIIFTTESNSKCIRLVKLNLNKTAAHLKFAKFCPRQIKPLYSNLKEASINFWLRNGWMNKKSTFLS